MYYFIGIKGSGMAPLATIMYELGHEVAGSDIDKFIFTQVELESRNIPIYSFDPCNIKDGMTVIIGNAFGDDHPEVKAALENKNVICHRYFTFLGHLMENYVSISVAGTHGKTTTTGLAYHLFKEFDKTSVLIGDGTGHGLKDSRYFIAESCEYQDHFLSYFPKYAIINNVELDHVDYFTSMEMYVSSFEKFANQVQDTVIAWGDDPYLRKMKFEKRALLFGLNDRNDVKAKNVLESKNGMSFDVVIHGELFGHFDLPFYGKHMLYNALAVITLGYLENMEANYIQKRLACFEGVKRRYTVKEVGNNIYVDDYAHHPTAIKLVIEASRVRYPGKKIVAVFKPDRFSRGARFANEFAKSMDSADYCYFCPFPENAAKQDGIDICIEDIAKLLPRSKVISEDELGAKELAQYDDVVFLFMSSKDIYKLEEKVIFIKQNTI